ncbi:MAG: GNAT family N-acetyltransferase [Sulfitobacter sp.]
MTPTDLARIHAAAFADTRGWSSNEFADLLTPPHTQIFSKTGGFAVTRTIAGETELLTLAVAPDFQRRGIAKSLLSDWLSQAARVADTAFLEVAADNLGALALYSQMSFLQSGRRKSYYARANGEAIDAILMTRALT